MKICMLSTSDIGHGAGISAYNLLNGFLAHGHECTMYVSEKRSSNPHVVEIQGDTFLWHLGKRIEQKLSHTRFQSIFSANVLCTTLAKKLNQYDVINCHNLHWHNRSLSPLIFWLVRKPIVWTVHDMWPITGHCIFNYENCEGYTSLCQLPCPRPDQYISMNTGAISGALKIKKLIYDYSKLHLVSPSQWLTGCIKASAALKPLSLHTIPYSVDTDTFYARDRAAVGKNNGVACGKFTILFSAGHVQDARKGIQFFVKALLNLATYAQHIQILLVGAGKIPAYLSDVFETLHLGQVTCRQKMAEIYSLADITVVPTLADNLPNVVLESMACGTPVVAFATGGVPDMISNNIDGYIVSRENIAELSAKILFLFQNAAELHTMSAAASNKMRQDYSCDVQVRKYEQLFTSITQ